MLLWQPLGRHRFIRGRYVDFLIPARILLRLGHVFQPLGFHDVGWLTFTWHECRLLPAVSVPDGQSPQASRPHTHSVVDRSGRPSHRSHTPCMTGSRCHARSRNISRCLSTGTASAHLLDVLRRSAGCRRRPPASGGKKGAGGSALPPGTSPEPAAQGVYVNTPRRYAGLRRRQAACVQFGHVYHAGFFREAGWLSSRSRKGKESDGSKPHGRDPHIPRSTPAAPGPIPLHSRSTRANPAALPQRPDQPRCAPEAPRPIPMHPRSTLFRISPWGKFSA